MTALAVVTLNGQLGKKFGRKWKLAVESVSEALQLIEANKPGVLSWMRANMTKFDRYHVKIERHDGAVNDVSEQELSMTSVGVKSITITPVIAGAGAGLRIVIGAVLMVASFWLGPAAPYAFSMGAALALGGIIELLSPTPKVASGSQRSDKTSYYFDGPVNTVDQGVPVPLIYGRILAGSQVISARVTIDQLM